MEITGKLIQILPEEKGEGRNGPWKSKVLFLKPRSNTQRKCITVWGDKIDLNSFGENSLITASINVESREYNGRWYTDVKAWRIVNTQESSPSAPDTSNIPPSTEIPPETDDDFNDLPFNSFTTAGL